MVVSCFDAVPRSTHLFLLPVDGLGKYCRQAGLQVTRLRRILLSTYSYMIGSSAGRGNIGEQHWHGRLASDGLDDNSDRCMTDARPLDISGKKDLVP